MEAVKSVETPIQKRYYPKGRVNKKKIIANQRLAMRVAPLGDKDITATQST